MHVEEQRRYHRLGASYFWFAGKRRLALRLLRAFRPAPESSQQLILDVGCGPGHDFADLSQLGSVVMLDASYEALRLCREAGGKLMVCAGGEGFPFPDRRFDTIVILDVLEHLTSDVDCLRECLRVLKPGGRLLATVPAFQWLWGAHDTLYGHQRRYTVPELVRKMREAGFAVDRATYIEWIFTLPLWIMRRVKGAAGPLKASDDFVGVPRWLNALLTKVITAEGAWLTRGTLPWGVSIICVAHPAEGS
jgi:SAM-dependent methyltransferase